jgi:hypothetical protein
MSIYMRRSPRSPVTCAAAQHRLEAAYGWFARSRVSTAGAPVQLLAVLHERRPAGDHRNLDYKPNYGIRPVVAYAHWGASARPENGSAEDIFPLRS